MGPLRILVLTLSFIPLVIGPAAAFPNDSLTGNLGESVKGLPESVQEKILAKPQEFRELLAAVLSEPAPVFVLVDKNHPLSESFVPADKVPLKGHQFKLSRDGLELSSLVIPDLTQMVSAARSDQTELEISSTYRSYESQRSIHNQEIKEYGKAVAEKESAEPGKSQHQLGTVIDFGSISDDFEKTPAGRWLSLHAWEYGFSLSYPPGWDQVTGYRGESWHYRYLTKPGARMVHEFFGDIQQYFLEFLEKGRQSVVEGPRPDLAETSLRTMVREPRSALNGKSYLLYRWDQFPKILLLDVADFPTQDRMFSRLAFFLEKDGFRGKLLTNQELAGRHGWNAHDYGAPGLAAFFTAVQQKKLPLNSEELQVEKIALDEGILVEQNGEFHPGTGGILSISRSSSDSERRMLLAHESFHGIFFASVPYRAFSFQLWDEATEPERQFFTQLMAALGYDPTDRYLVVNEFQAYLMQQPLSSLARYLRRVGSLLDRATSSTSFDVEAVLPAFEKTARQIDDYLTNHFQITAGGETYGTPVALRRVLR